MRTLAIAALVAALGTVVAVSVLTSGSPRPEARFSVLERQRGPEDELPSTDAGTLPELVVPGSARRVGELGGQAIYVATGEGGRTCFLHADDAGVGGGCIDRRSLTNRATYVGTGDGRSIHLIVPVPDGYEKAELDGRVLPARNNVVLTSVPEEDGKLELAGEAGTLEGYLPFGPDAG